MLSCKKLFSVVVIVVSELKLIACMQTLHPPFFTPCTFPSPKEDYFQFRRACTRPFASPPVPFLCDAHQQLEYAEILSILNEFQKHKAFLTYNGTDSLGIVVVRQLAQPLNTNVVYYDKEYSCLFTDECNKMDKEMVEKFVTNTRIFLKIYTSTLFNRWFPVHECPNVLALIVLEGIVSSDPRKVSTVNLHTDDVRLSQALMNIQMESTNAILQGLPLHEVLTDLIRQLGNALRDFYLLRGRSREYFVPSWAWYMFGSCAILVMLALLVEWYIVRRKLVVKRSPSGIVLHVTKSKTHLMF